MKLLISITTKAETKANLNDLFIVFDTDKKQFIRKLNFIPNVQRSTNDIHRGTGMCYYENFWYAGITCFKHRIGSKLLIIDLKTGNQTISDLSLTKAVHSIYPYGKCSNYYNMILACSTQNDCISIITTLGNKVVTEDIYFDYLTNNRRLKLDWSKEYLHDDILHINGIYVDKNNVYSCMFYDYKSYEMKLREPGIARAYGIPLTKFNVNNRKDLPVKEFEKMAKEKRNNWRQNKEKMKGAVYDLNNQKLLRKTAQPHSLIINQFNEIVFCESGTFKIININKNTEAQCKGFTRGLWEDKQRGGYWAGLSYHRVYSTKINGAALQFISYDMEIKDFIDLSKFGKEIYDVIPYKEGKWS